MKQISIQDLKARLESRVAEAQSAAEILITRHKTSPSRQLCPAHHPQKVRSGAGGGLAEELRPAVKTRNQGPVSRRADANSRANGESGRQGRAGGACISTPPHSVYYTCSAKGDRPYLRRGCASNCCASVLLVLEARRTLITAGAGPASVENPDKYNAAWSRSSRMRPLSALRGCVARPVTSNLAARYLFPRSLDLAHWTGGCGSTRLNLFIAS